MTLVKFHAKIPPKVYRSAEFGPSSPNNVRFGSNLDMLFLKSNKHQNLWNSLVIMVMAWLRPTFHEIRRSIGGENHCYRPPAKCEDNVACATKNVHFIEATEDQEEGELKPSKPDEAYKPEDVTHAEHTKKIPLCKDVPDRTVIIGKGLDEAEQARLVQFLRNNQDVFTWTSSDLRGVSRGIMEHSL